MILARPVRIRPLRALLIGGTAAVLPALGVFAQDTGGTQLVFGIGQKLELLDNPGLAASSPGTQVTATTTLSFGLTSATPGQTVTLDGDLGLILTRNPDGSTDVTVGNTPHLGFGYDQTTVSSAVKADLSYGRDWVDRVRSLDEFIGEDGSIDLPTSPDALVSTGLEESLKAGASLDLGLDAPFGVTLSADYSKTVFSETTDPLLLDETAASVGIKGRFDYSELGKVTLGFSANRTTTEGSPTEDSQSVTLGTSYDVSPVLSLSGSASYKVNDGSTSAQVGVDYALLNGSLSLDLGSDAAELVWQQSFPTGRVTARISHGPDDSGDGTTDLLGLGYNQSINPTSGLGLGLFYSDTNSPTQDVVGTDLIASYNHALTQDWGMNVGVNYRLRDNGAAGSANSAGVFISVSRNFSFGE